MLSSYETIFKYEMFHLELGKRAGKFHTFLFVCQKTPLHQYPMEIHPSLDL